MTAARPINCALIDLDDCLYREEAITRAVRENIQRYIHQHLNIPEHQVADLTLELYYGYGTTLAGLLARGFTIDVDYFHSFVHGSLDYSLLQPDPKVREVLLAMECPRYLLTNADAKHARVCLARLGLEDCFNGVYAYEAVQELARAKGLLTSQQPMLCKPSPEVYQLVCAAVGAEPSTTLFVDDSPRNIAAAHGVGILSVLVGREGKAAGADACIPTFVGLASVVPQLFRNAPSEERRNSTDGVAASSQAIRVPS